MVSTMAVVNIFKSTIYRKFPVIDVCFLNAVKLGVEGFGTKLHHGSFFCISETRRRNCQNIMDSLFLQLVIFMSYADT